jgi:translation initiation factor 2B subunit (eIF-2B alpha/beta/delta family)
MPGLDAALAELTEDREHGASWMARRAVETLLEVAEQPFSSSDELFGTLVDAGRKLAESRPGVGAIAGAAGRVLAAANAHRFLEPDELRRLVEEEAGSILHGRERAAASIAVQLQETIDGKVVMTHSASATVREALVHGSPAKAICTVSDPVGEGRAFAEDLRGEGLSVDLVADGDAPNAIETVDVFLIGADTVFRCGTLCNKIGTTRLAEAAQKHGVPTIVACEIVKLAPIDVGSAPEQSEAEKKLFEMTPPELLTEIYTEEGAVSPDEVAPLVDRTPFLRDGYALLLPANAL